MKELQSNVMCELKGDIEVFEEYILKHSKEFSKKNNKIFYLTNDKIESKLNTYKEFLRDVRELEQKDMKMANLFCIDFSNSYGGDTYSCLSTMVKVATHYFELSYKKDKWGDYFRQIKSIEVNNFSKIKSGKWGYDYTLVDQDGEEMEATTHPSDNPITWIFDEEKFRVLHKERTGNEVPKGLFKSFSASVDNITKIGYLKLND